MKNLYPIISRIAAELPSDSIYAAANIIAKGDEASCLNAAWGSRLSERKIISDFSDAAVKSGLSYGEIASALKAAACTVDHVQKGNDLDILWTGPKSSSVPVRRMEQSLCELIEAAKKRLFIVSFVAYRADKIYTAIREAIGRGVRVSFLTEASKEHGGSLDVDPSDALKKKFPKAEFYRWENPDPSSPAVVHAKCAVADDKMALVTSANLTGAAMEKNMELGLLLKDQKVAGRLSSHFEALIAEDIIRKV